METQILYVTKDLKVQSYTNINCWYVPQVRPSSLIQLSGVFHALSTTTHCYKVNYTEKRSHYAIPDFFTLVMSIICIK